MDIKSMQKELIDNTINSINKLYSKRRVLKRVSLSVQEERYQVIIHTLDKDCELSVPTDIYVCSLMLTGFFSGLVHSGQDD